MSKDIYCRTCKRTTEHYYHQLNEDGRAREYYYCGECGDSVEKVTVNKGLWKKIMEAKKK